MQPSRTHGQSIQDRIRAMNETLDKVEATPSLELTATVSEERTVSTLESSSLDKVQHSATQSEETVAPLTPSKRSSVVDMWRQREGPRTQPSPAAAASDRPKVSSGVRQVVVAPPFAQKRRSPVVASPELKTPQEDKKDTEDGDQVEITNQSASPTAVRSMWQQRQSPAQVTKPVWTPSPTSKDRRESLSSQLHSPGGRKSFDSSRDEVKVPSQESVAQIMWKSPSTPRKTVPKSPVAVVSQEKQQSTAKIFPSFKNQAPVDLTIVPSTNDNEADTRLTPGSRRSRVSDLVAAVSKHEQEEGSPIPDIHQTKSASPSTESTGARRSSVVDFWKSRTSQSTLPVADRPPSSDAPRKSLTTRPDSLKDVFEKRKEKDTHSDDIVDHENHRDAVANIAQEENADADRETVTTSVADRWSQSTGNRFVGKLQNHSAVGRASDVPRKSATSRSDLKDIFEKRKEKDIHSDDTVEQHTRHTAVPNTAQQEEADAVKETGTTIVANRWTQNAGNRFVGNNPAHSAVGRGSRDVPPLNATKAANVHEPPDHVDSSSPHAISFKEKARLFEEKSSQNRPGFSGPNKKSYVNNKSGKETERLGGKPGPSPSNKGSAIPWNQSNVNKVSVHMNSIDNSSGSATAGSRRLPQIPPIHPKKGMPLEVSPKSFGFPRKNELYDSLTQGGIGSPTRGIDDLSTPDVSSRLDASGIDHNFTGSRSGPAESPTLDAVTPEKIVRETATHARSASTGSFGELLPDPNSGINENPTPSLKRHSRIPSAGSIGELGARYNRAPSVGSIGEIMASSASPTETTSSEIPGATKSKDGSNKKLTLPTRIVKSLQNETKNSELTGPKPSETTVLPKPLRFQKNNSEETGEKKRQERFGDALVSSKESAFDSWSSKSDVGNEEDAISGFARKRNRRNLASLGKRHIAKTLAQKPTHGDANSLTSNQSSSIFSGQRSMQSQNKETGGAPKRAEVVMNDYHDNAWPSQGLDLKFSLSVDSGSPGHTQIPDEIITKKTHVQTQSEKNEPPQGGSPSRKPSSTKSNYSDKSIMADVLGPVDEYKWSEPAVNSVTQHIPQSSEYTALHVSVSEPKWKSNSDLSHGVKSPIQSPGFEDNRSDFSVFSDSVFSAVSKSPSASSLANRAERALQARRRKNRPHITTIKETRNVLAHSNQHHATHPDSKLHLTNLDKSNPSQGKLGYRYDEAYALSLTEKRRAAGLTTTYKTSSRFMEEGEELAVKSARQPIRESAEDEASVESGVSSYRTLETATSESESPWSKGTTNRRIVGPVPERFIDESAENMDNFQKAFESLGLSQIASDLAREVRLATLDISNLAKGMNETVKTFRTPAYTRSKAMIPKEDAPFDEDVAIEVEYLEDYADDDDDDDDDDDESDSNPLIKSGTVDDFASGEVVPAGQPSFEQPSSNGRGTKSAYV